MKSYLNFLKRNKSYSAINLVGLSISMAFVLLLAVYVQKQLSTDAFQKNADRIYAVTNPENLNMGYYLPQYLSREFPDIEAASSYIYQGVRTFVVENKSVNTPMAIVDSLFFKMFSFEMVSGSGDDFKISKNNILISESFASSYFQEKNPIGQKITLGDYSLNVVGVYKNPENSIFKPVDIYVRGEFASGFNSANNEDMDNAGGAVCFVMTYPNSKFSEKNAEVLEYLKEIFWIYMNGSYDQVRMIPFRDIYFLENGAIENNGGFNLGDFSFVKILFSMCVILLLFAVLNYINMTTALSGFRAKEMATRRLLGSSKAAIFFKMMAESTLFCLISMLVALVFAELLSPLASEILNYNISLSSAFSLKNIISLIAFIIILGFISGLIPSLLLLRAKPIDVVKGNLVLKTKTIYSKIIIIVQNSLTVMMIVASLVVYLQVKKLVDAPLGYNTKDILSIENHYSDKVGINPLVDKIKSLACVEEVGLGEGTPLTGTNNLTFELGNGQWISTQQIKGDSSYFNILGLREKQNNNVPKTFWLDEHAFKEIGIEESATTYHAKNNTQGIGGVYYDFKIGNILNEQKSIMLYNYNDYPEYEFPWNIIVKTSGDKIQAKQQIMDCVKELFPDAIHSSTYLEDSLDEMFSRESQILKIIFIFTIISLIVSALGLVAMSSYYMQQQRKTVSVKKVFGASYHLVLSELIFSFLKLIGISFIIGIPLAYYLMHTWLGSYSYRIDLHWWIFIVAALFTLIIATLAVLWQSIKTANTNPATEMKKE